ncbi:glutamate-5-semialdehyde dehydrogenase [Actinomadura barringtoniae]|uniref:Gamma-glutamyl phosphate reductase n=1 Tax=Actinomadura barringtoniae TaxID=1427535 RepID=A0A939PCT4_9ACTN|nr:glutamate-5-semialdehyde dehydrogenase [Actinomadura barringtoniae]MBO2450266.1 glutamate-5-semialdehyde dehydrogenase [Actinomadura barringtoniae]
MTDEILRRAREAQRSAPPVGDKAYRAFVQAARERMDAHWTELTEAGDRDIAQARERGLSEALIERLRLTDRHRSALENAFESVGAALPHHHVAGESVHGMGDVRAHRVLRPLGVILMIFEARAEITLRSAVMCAATGNAVLLRGGSEIAETNKAVGGVLQAALADAELPAGLVTILDSGDRRELRALLKRDDEIDVVIPRGSPSLIETCRTTSRIPMITGGGGANHLYVHRTADPRVAAELTLDGKLPDPAACTALETVLVDEAITDAYLTALGEAASAPDAERLTLRVPEDLASRAPSTLQKRLDPVGLGPHDDGREFLDQTLAIRTVPDLTAATDHIRRFGSGHTEGVLTNDDATAEAFCARVDAAAIVVNGSLRLNDAPAMGLGAALAISTGRLHARGPVTLDTLFTHSWIVEGANTSRFRKETSQ